MRSKTLWLFLIPLIFYLLFLGKELLIPLIFALFIWHLINALAALFRFISVKGRRLPNCVCSLLSIGTILSILAIFIQMLTTSVYEFVEAAPAYEVNLETQAEKLLQRLDSNQRLTLEQFSHKIDLSSMLPQFARAVTSIFGNTAIIFIYLVFLFIEQSSFDQKLSAIFYKDHHKDTVFKIIKKIKSDTLIYVGIKTFTSALTACFSYLVMSIIGLDFAMFWAILIFFFNYIPTVGSILATIFPSLLALLQFESLYPFFIIAGGVTFLQLCIGSLLEPRLMGKSLNLSPLVILFSLALWGKLWGISGMFLCIPITVVTVIILSHFPGTRPIAILLSADGHNPEDKNNRPHMS